jgi:hypothetical protein
MGGDTPKQDVTTTNTKGATLSDTSSTMSNIVKALTGQTTSGSQQGTQFGAQDVAVPDWLKQFVGGATGTAGTALSTAGDLASGYQIPPEALKALQDTAGGNYLYGGPQQQAFIDAAVRGASPGIFSQFGAAGGGGGGLQKAALDQAAVDAYAKLYGSERENQLSAATALPGISQMPFNMQAQLAQLAGGLPGQFSPFLGATSFGQTGQNTFGQASGFSNTNTTGTDTSHMTGNTTGQTREIKPLYQTPWWQTALGAVGATAGLLGSLNPVTGVGTAAKALPMVGGLVGAFR